ncbi:hypothetical protein BZG36_05022 [Bifiguratus adelaidae]|uniref:F-box domain-containing protein n=1 Tax=Bifiguratus adelaidae TaxID=1938954 RepID=A0A261XXW0_9FUNG|nr:hypothetical protein BZG36_05022 [Bifiguratus adelaidae]
MATFAELPAELQVECLAWLPLRQLYKLRILNHKLKHSVERALYRRLELNDSCAQVRFEVNAYDGVELSLRPSGYNADEGVVEFRPTETNALTLNSQSSTSSLYMRYLKLRFSEWLEEDPPYVSSLPPHVLFHTLYNPALRKIHEIPPLDTQGTIYIGDEDFVLQLEFEQVASPTCLDTVDGQGVIHGASQPDAPNRQVRIHTLHVSLSWLVSGTRYTGSRYFVETIPIYAARHRRLSTLLEKHGISHYDRFDSQVLRYIRGEPRLALEDKHPEAVVHLPDPLVHYLKRHPHDQYTRSARETLEHLLLQANVDPRMLWKHSTAREYVLGNHLADVEVIVQRLVLSEESAKEWEKGLVQKRRNGYNRVV